MAESSAFLDVRTKDEWEQDHVAGAIHIPLNNLLNGSLPDVARTTPIKVFCNSGNRSALAANYLTQAGFTDVENISTVIRARELMEKL